MCGVGVAGIVVVVMELEGVRRFLLCLHPKVCGPRRFPATETSPFQCSEQAATPPRDAIGSGEVRGGCYNQWLARRATREEIYGGVVEIQHDEHEP
jgi:hypothetical protein